MRKPLTLAIILCLVVFSASAKEPFRRGPGPGYDRRGPFEEITVSSPGLFSPVSAGTTWLGADPTGMSVVEGGVWDFDNRGTITCPAADVPDVYIKNGAFAQGWTSLDVYEQKGLHWHAEDFTDPGLSCSPGPLEGVYSAWCGLVTPDPGACFVDAPGYGSSWSQWLCRTVALAASNNSLQYTLQSHTEPDFDYCYVLIDKEFPDSCGWVGDLADTIRCYDGPNPVQTEVINLSNLTADPALCDDLTTANYDGDTAKICFVVTSDTAWDDEDGEYSTCDGAMMVDGILVTARVAGHDTTLYEDFEAGAIDDFDPGAGWGKCGGWSSGDYSAIRDISSFVNSTTCGFTTCGMSGCVLTFFDPSIPGEYGMGGHYAGPYYNRAWSPAIYVGSYPPRSYTLQYDAYYDLPLSNFFYYRRHVSYIQDPNCPTGGWSPPLSDDYWYDLLGPHCGTDLWDFGQFVPSDAESVRVSLGAYNMCIAYGMPCTNGNESPIFDNVRVGILDTPWPIPWAYMVANYTDAFPEANTLSADAWAVIDAAENLSPTGDFIRLADTLTVALMNDDTYAELCFRVVPGPGTDLSHDFFTTWFPDTYAACDTSDFHYARMDTAFKTGPPQKADRPYYASTFHEEDPRFSIVGGEGVEILPDSLFTPGSKIFYYIRTSYVPGPGPYRTMPAGANPSDLSTLYEVSVLPDMCKDPPPCLLYVDYYNRGNAQKLIENALTSLGRTWDRFDRTASSDLQGNGIGNRLLGAGKYRLDRNGVVTTDRLIIGPSIEHLAQYSVILMDNGSWKGYETFSNGDTGWPTNDPTDDIGFLDAWLNQPGGGRGLWLSGDDIASGFDESPSGSMQDFLANTLGCDLVDQFYQDLVGHDLFESCRRLNTRYGNAASCNYYDTFESVSLKGSGCPERNTYDVISASGLGGGIGCEALLYDRTDQTHPPGLYASVDHIYPVTPGGMDTVRTKIDGFSLEWLRDYSETCTGGNAIAFWIRDVLGGQDPVAHPGYFFDRTTGQQYCPPVFPESVTDVPFGDQEYSYSLSQNYPNPFRGSAGTTIRYSVAKPGTVELWIFDAAGRLVRRKAEKVNTPGHHTMNWDGMNEDGHRVPTGVYFYQIKAGDFSGHKRMVLLR